MHVSVVIKEFSEKEIENTERAMHACMQRLFALLPMMGTHYNFSIDLYIDRTYYT